MVPLIQSFMFSLNSTYTLGELLSIKNTRHGMGMRFLSKTGSKEQCTILKANCARVPWAIVAYFLNSVDRLSAGKPEFPIREGKLFHMSGREFEVDHVIQPNEFVSGSCFGRATLSDLPIPTVASSSVLSKQFIPPQRNANLPNSTSNNKAIDPASFYGAPAKPKPGKPLCVTLYFRLFNTRTTNILKTRS
jgi:hypothetical protein